MRIREIIISVNQIPLVKEFYNAKLKFDISSESESYVSFNAGSSILTFTENNGHDNPFYHFAFNIPKNKINEAFNLIKHKTEIINNEIYSFGSWNADFFYFRDPAGNIVEFIARHNLKNEAEEEFNTGRVECISEIGIVCKDVLATAKELNEKLNIPYWKNRSSEFTTLGDEDGLLILVNEKRNWFPTEIPSGLFPLTVKLGDNSGSKFEIQDLPYKFIY